MMNFKNKAPKHGPHNIGMWNAIRDVCVELIQNGLGVLVLATFVVALCVYRMPADDLAPLIQRVIEGLADYSLLGYFLAVVILVVSCLLFAAYRKVAKGEEDRLGRQKTLLQERLTGKNLGSSQN